MKVLIIDLGDKEERGYLRKQQFDGSEKKFFAELANGIYECECTDTRKTIVLNWYNNAKVGDMLEVTRDLWLIKQSKASTMSSIAVETITTDVLKTSEKKQSASRRGRPPRQKADTADSDKEAA